MDEKVARILAVYHTLSSKQKKELIEQLKKRERNGTFDGALDESYTRIEKGHTVVMGPLGGTCPYCGR